MVPGTSTRHRVGPMSWIVPLLTTVLPLQNEGQVDVAIAQNVKLTPVSDQRVVPLVMTFRANPR